MDSSRRKCLEIILQNTLVKLHQKGLTEEYKKVEDVGPTPGDAWAQHDAMVSRGLCEAAVKNSEKNRYCNLYPFDSERVKLQVPKDKSDYINASWIKIPGVETRFILTMAPLHPMSFSSSHPADFGMNSSVSTCADFWRMVQQTNSKRIIMLCKIEPGYTGCAQYFPTEQEVLVTFDEYSITLDKEISREDISVDRTLNLAWDGNSRMINHSQFNLWPNYGVVENVSQLADFVKKILEETQACEGPVMVHCSGGIGRSGAFTSILSVLYLLNKYVETGSAECLSGIVFNEEICLVELVRGMREQRHPWMVEGEKQYLLIYSTVLHLLQEMLMES